MDCFYAFDMWDADLLRQEADYLSEQEYEYWSRKIEDEAYDLILPAYFADKDASEKEESSKKEEVK